MGRTNYAIKDINDFLSTGYKAAEVVVPEGYTVHAVYQAYAKAAKRVGGVQIFKRKDHVYMLKE